MADYGYVRVSTGKQNVERQIEAMQLHGITDICIEKQSGKDFDRTAYLKLISRLLPGDCLCMMSIDRLGRNYAEIIEQWRHITHDLQADIFVLDMPLLDTRKCKDLMGTFVADLVLQILSFVAHNERETMICRVRGGIAAAKAKGVKFGRPRLVLPEWFPLAYGGILQGFRSINGVCHEYGISRSTYYRYVKLLSPDFVCCKPKGF
jgi:DNA invertase Pin-like site-specific DNA recombinase